jgi:hypothetical protein
VQSLVKEHKNNLAKMHEIEKKYILFLFKGKASEKKPVKSIKGITKQHSSQCKAERHGRKYIS